MISFIRRIREKQRLSKLPVCGKNVHIEKPIIIDYPYVEIGDDSHILRDARIQNVSHSDATRLRIGNNTGIQYRFSCLLGADVEIGSHVAIASDVFLSAGNHGINPECGKAYGEQKYIGEPIRIKDKSWIGEKVVIMSGVTVGEGSIIGSGAIVTKDVPDYSIAVGNPARIIKRYNFESHKWEKV